MTEQRDVIRVVKGPPGRRVRLYLVVHPDGVRRVLVGNSSGYTKDTALFREMSAYLGDGIVTTDGEIWRRQRRVVAPLFTAGRIAGYVTMMADEATRMAERWAGRSRVDLHAEMTGYALRVVGRTLLGTDIDDAIAVVRATFPVLGEHALRRANNPLRPPRIWPTPGNRRAARARREINAVVDEIIARRRRFPDDAPGDDLVSMLLAVRDPDTGNPLTDLEIRDQLLIFLLAAHETTATALTFTCYLLGRHPEAQGRVRAEVLGQSPPTATDLPRLRYTTMVIKEAMRLYPPSAATSRFTPDGDFIGDQHIPAGSTVLLSPWSTHRHPEFWPDPERFDPERFDPAAESARHRHAYFPFGAGPRVCIGQHFAMTEALVAIATLLSRFTLRTDPQPPRTHHGITLRPAGPIPCEIGPAE